MWMVNSFFYLQLSVHSVLFVACNWAQVMCRLSRMKVTWNRVNCWLGRQWACLNIWQSFHPKLRVYFFFSLSRTGVRLNLLFFLSKRLSLSFVLHHGSLTGWKLENQVTNIHRLACNVLLSSSFLTRNLGNDEIALKDLHIGKPHLPFSQDLSTLD